MTTEPTQVHSAPLHFIRHGCRSDRAPRGDSLSSWCGRCGVWTWSDDADEPNSLGADE